MRRRSLSSFDMIDGAGIFKLSETLAGVFCLPFVVELQEHKTINVNKAAWRYLVQECDATMLKSEQNVWIIKILRLRWNIFVQNKEY